MSKIIIPLPNADFDPTEAAVTWKVLTQNQVEVEFATPDGKPAQCDPRMLTGFGLGVWAPILKANRQGISAYSEMIQDFRFKNPIQWRDIESTNYNGIVLPGGHARGMRPYLESEVLQRTVAVFAQTSKLIGAICHGMVLAARSRLDDGTSVICGYKATALLSSQEMIAWAITFPWLGNYYRTYPETVQSEVTKALGKFGQFFTGPIPLTRDSFAKLERGFVVEDRNLISARWPGDAHRFGTALVRYLQKQNLPTCIADK